MENNVLANIPVVVSIALSVVFLGYCLEVMHIWAKPFLLSIKKGAIDTPNHRLAKGIWLGFTANFFDNVYWMVTWFSVYMQWEIHVVLFAFGALFNIFFRQLGGILAAKNHIIAAKDLPSNTTSNYRRLYWLAGVITAIVVWHYG